MEPRTVIEISLAAIVLFMVLVYLWLHGVFCRHVWDTQRLTSDLCVKCGRIRFKDPVQEFLKRIPRA